LLVFASRFSFFVCLCVFFQRKLHTRRALSMFFVSISFFYCRWIQCSSCNSVFTPLHARKFVYNYSDYSGWSKCKRRRFEKVSNDLLRLTSAQKFRSAFYKRAYT